MIDEAEISAAVSALLEEVEDGEDLDPTQVLLINVALHTSAMALDADGAREWIGRALEAGVTSDQVQEVITLISGMGVHAFFEASRALAERAAPAGGWGPFDPERQAIWDRRIASTKYWTTMQEELPGFLESLLRMSPDAFEAFIDYVGLPFRSRHVSMITKELIGMAADACPAHIYLPGMRMHLRNAVRLGAGRVAIRHTMQIAAASPRMVGVR
jgi:alkylhydroperoxidase/carboxymuconolactone decarboxylase family protein YurZ